MKKILFFICVITVVITALVSCNAHEHTFSDKWTGDPYNHWHAATCEHAETERGDFGPHVDVDEDGFCEDCAYKVGHDHKYSTEWTSDDEKHWKAATCTHADEKIEVGRHVDANGDGECDVCAGHVHIDNNAGFCKLCGDVLVTIDENNFDKLVESVISRHVMIISGKIDYYAISRFKNESDNSEIAHIVEYLIGTNGTYTKRSYDEVITTGNFFEGTAAVSKTGNTEILEKWIKKVSPEEVEGIAAISVNGAYKSAEPSSFTPDELAGYYFAISTLADGYGPEAILFALYNASIPTGESKVTDFNVVTDVENNKCSFSYNILVVHQSTLSDGSVVYNANYFEVKVDFTYSENFVLTSLDIVCDCYTSDPGGNGVSTLEEEIDLDYDPTTGTFTMRDNARADTYTISVEQTSGIRGEIELEDGARFAPTDVKISASRGSESEIESFTVTVGDFGKAIYIVPTTPGTFVKFLPNGMQVKVLNQHGRPSTGGLMATINNDAIELLPTVAGEYTVQFTSGETVKKSIKITVEKETVAGEYSFQLTASDNNTFEGNLYTFTAEKAGEYTFYCPSYGVGIWEKSAYADDSVGPLVDYQDPFNNARSFTIELEAGEEFSFYYMLAEKNTAFTVGYDIAE